MTQERKTAFYLTQEEAEVAARCDMGIGDSLDRWPIYLVGILILWILARTVMGMPLPSFRLMGGYLIAAGAWILFLFFLKERKKLLREEYLGKPFYLTVSGEGIAVGKYPEEDFFRAAWTEIRQVEEGSEMIRLTADSGRVCLPVRILETEEREKIASLEVRKQRKKWM